MDWTEQQIEQLRALWAEGLSTAEIGRRMGISKNAVVGKAHRLNLPSRPSPIRRSAKPSSPRPATVPRAVSAAVAAAAVVTPLTPRPSAPPPPPRPAPRLGNTACCWPIGEPGKTGFRFCDAPALYGKPYCAEHAAQAYVRAKADRQGQESAA